MKKTAFTAIAICFLALTTAFAQKAKYVFYFIGDGMGMNQVNLTEVYRAQIRGKTGIEPLLYANLPVLGFAYTYSWSNPITDSAAGGTALSTGQKTYNGAIGVDKDKKPIKTIAEAARNAGARVGIMTTVSIDHATPACFYAHQESRKYYYEIATDLPKSKFDYFAGSGFLSPAKDHLKKDTTNVFSLFDEAGYTVARGLADFKAKEKSAKRLILMQESGKSVASLPYAIDRKSDDMALSDLLTCGISFLTKNSKKGFFIMAEGGKIDWACHSNDVGTMVHEVEDFDAAIRVAFEFYKRHPKETLIVISADHETGGLGMGNSDYMLHLPILKNQKTSIDMLPELLKKLSKEKNGNVSWEDMRQFLSDNFGFFTSLKLTWQEERALHDAFEADFVQKNGETVQRIYSTSNALTEACRNIMAKKAHIGWTTLSHTAGYVPVMAVGVGQELFRGKMNNIEIPKRIAKVAGYKL